MSKPKLIGPVAETAAADQSTARSSARILPHDLLKEASNRLSVIALVGTILWPSGTILGHLAYRAMGHSDWLAWNGTDTIAVASVLMSFGVCFYGRFSHRDPRYILDVGLVFMILTCFALGMTLHWTDPTAHRDTSPVISWLGAVVLMFAAIVPNSRMKTLVASVLAVSMNPLSMILAKLLGRWDFGSWTNAFVMHYPDYLLAGVTVVISHVVTRLGHQVTKARDMGSYRLVKMLGKGGMGEVWRASHRMLARDAAIKLIQPYMLTRGSGTDAETVRRRFEQEAKATASLRSPHTVELYDFGVTDDGTFYYVMELLEGIDLETLVKQYGAQPPARVASIVRQVCRSLADAHRHGMVHRDIKPTNIFLCRLGNEFDFVKVLDFGLVKMIDREEAMTGQGIPTGTPAYMAPELALGNAHVDGRTDLYGLGCVAYWLVTGKLVFEEQGSTAMMLAHVQKAPAPPSTRTDGPVPASLERAVMMCLNKEPAGRPPGADMLARILETAEDLGSWTAQDAERWWSIHVPEDGVAKVEADSNTLTI